MNALFENIVAARDVNAAVALRNLGKSVWNRHVSLQQVLWKNCNKKQFDEADQVLCVSMYAAR